MISPVLANVVDLNAASGTQYMPVCSSIMSQSTTEAEVKEVAPVSGSFKKFSVKLVTAPGAGKSWTFTVRVNGVDTSMAVTISESDTTGSDLSPINFNKGDVITVKATSSGSPATTKLSYYFMCNANGNPWFFGSTGDLNASATRYFMPYGATGVSATETENQCIIPTDGTLTTLCINLETAPGSGKSYTFTVRKNGVDTALIVVVSDSNTTGEATGSIDITTGDRITIKVVPSGTPAIGLVQGGILCVPDVDGTSMQFTSTNAMETTATVRRFSPAGFCNSGMVGSDESQIIYPSCTVKSMYVWQGSPTDSGADSNTWQFTVNSVGSAIAVVLANPNSEGSDTGDVSISDGDLINVVVTYSNTSYGSDDNAAVGIQTFIQPVKNFDDFMGFFE